MHTSTHEVFGSSGTTSTHSGHANPGKRFFACSFKSVSNSARFPFHLSALCGCNITNAIARSPHLGCERATTATSSTSGWVESSASVRGSVSNTSKGEETLALFNGQGRCVLPRVSLHNERLTVLTSPPLGSIEVSFHLHRARRFTHLIIISLLRSVMAMVPSGCLTARSPDQKWPPRNAFFVASAS
jgi:hypothetical protein